ncbi:MAG TPA: ABC transporter substrate-binding protein [Solirubrobacterales bacterium]|nr:ABC transporter substrate-binding protein [Solirubrobacterales bacterium]
MPLKARAISIVAVVCAAASLALAACGGSSEEGGEAGGTLDVAYNAFPDYLDPGLSYSLEGWTAMYDTYIPLLTYAHAEGEAGTRIIPGLAKALPKISDGGKTYTLFLRPGLEYSNGKPVRASDFTHAIERAFLLSASASPLYTDIVGAEKFAETKHGGIPGIETDDASGRIVIHLVVPRGTFSNELAGLAAAPVPASVPAEDQTASPPPATGPYVITTTHPGRGWEYARNPVWAKNNGDLMQQIPDGYANKIDVSVIRNASTEVDDVEHGKFDWMENPPPSDRIATVRSKYDGTQFRESPQINLYYFWMNTTQPPFDDLKVRQAVNYAVDPAALERIYAGQLTPVQQTLPPGMPGYRKFNLYPHNMAKAKELIAEAKPANRKVTVWGIDVSPNKEAAEYYEGVLRELGLEPKLKIVNADNYFTIIGNLSTPELDTGWADWYEDYPHPNDFLQLPLSSESIAPTNNTNWAQFADPQVDAKIAQLSREPLGPKQEAEYAALDREVMAQAPWAPYGSLKLSTFVSSDVDLEKLVISPIFGQDLTSFALK